LSREIEKDLNFCVDRRFVDPEYERLAKRLQNLSNFLLDNSMSGKSSLSLLEQVNQMEVQMYAIIEKVNAFDEDDNQSDQAIEDMATKLRENIIDLMKEMAIIKSNLRKAEPDKLPEKDVLLNKLEDLQENLADFEHNFSTKHFFNRGIGEKAKEKYKTKQLEDAQKAHERAESNMFEL